ncbi:hypothetical protein DITRI_Ditri05aG0100800 [Diplodiscus trichospermus]
MADQLASIYKENEEPISSEKLSTNPEAIGGENVAKLVKKQAKKVRFSPENQTIEYEVSVYQQPRRRSRKQLLSKNPVQTVENAPSSEDIRKVEYCQVRVTRSRAQNAVEDDENMVFSPPVGRKRRRGGMKNRDADADNIGKSQVSEMSERDVKNGVDKVTGGRQLRSRKNVIQEESKIRKGKGGDKVHFFDEISEASDVTGRHTKSKIGRNQPRRTARKEDQPVMSSEVEKFEVVSMVMQQSRTQPKDIASTVKSEVKTVGVRGGYDEVLQLKEPQKGRGKNALRKNVVPQAVSAESSLIAVGEAEAEKPLRRSKRNTVGDSAKNATSVRSETQLTKVQDQSERNIALEEPSECLRRHSSRRKSAVPQSGKGGNKEEFLKKETKKRSRTTELDAILEHGDEIERARSCFSLQDQAPLRRNRRNTVILNPPAINDVELANKEDINKMQLLGAPYLGKDVTEELPRKSSQNSSGEFSETSGLNSGSENTLKQVEEIIASDFSNRDGIQHMESSVKPTENQESSSEVDFATAETGAQKIIEIQHNSYSNTAAPEAPCGPAPANQFKDETCRVEATDNAGRAMSDNERSEDLNPRNAQFTHESVLVCEENTGVVKNDEEIRIHDDTFEGEMKHQSCLSLKGTCAVADSNLIEPRMVDLESNSSKMDSFEITSLVVHSSASQTDLAVKSSQRELEQVLETGEASENTNSIYCNMDAERSKTPIEEDQIKLQLKFANLTAANSIGEVILNDLLNELGGSIGLKRGPETPLKKSEKQGATDFFDGEGFAHTESSVEAIEKHECRAQTDIVTAITGTPKIAEMKWSSSSDTATYEALFGSAPESQDKLCYAGITASISGSAVCNQDEETNLVEDDKEILIQDDTVEGEIKYQPCLSLNKTSALDDDLVELGMVELESNANKVICSEMTTPADVCSSANQAKFSSETSNELKPEKVLESEESPRSKNVNYQSDKTEVEDVKTPAQEDQNSMQLENANTNAAESIQAVVSWDQLNEPCKTCGTEELKFSLQDVEETSTDDFSGKEMVQTESSVDINENSEATAKVHTLTAETGEKTITEMHWSVSSHHTTLTSPLRTEVGSQDLQGTIYRVETALSNEGEGHGMCGHQKNEEIVKIVENELDETINSEKELFFNGKAILEESFEGKLLAGGDCHQLSDRTDIQSAKGRKVDVSEESFNNVSCETEEKHVCEVLAEEGTGPVSFEEKDNGICESVSHADVSLQFICNEKLPLNSFLPVSNDMQGQPEAVCMDNNLRNEIQAYFLPQPAVEQLHNKSEAAKHGAENGEANSRAISNATQALPSEELSVPFISEPLSMRPHDHALADGESNFSGERVMVYPYNKGFTATMDSNGISASRETYVGEDDNTVVELAKSSLKPGLDHSGWKVVSAEFSEEIGTRLPFVKANDGDLDDLGEDIALQRDCSSSIGLDGPKSTAGIIVDNISKVGTLESTLSNNDPQSERKVEDVDENDSNAANEIDAAFIVEAELEDGRKTPVSHQRSLHGGKKEDATSYADKPGGKPEISLGSSTHLCSSISMSCEKELHSQVNDVGGTEVSIDCKVKREERDDCQIDRGGFSDVTDGSLVERSKGDVEEISEAKSDDCKSSVKTTTFIDNTNSWVVNRPLCLDDNKSSAPETKETHGLHLPNKLAGDSKEVGSCNKQEIVCPMKPKMVDIDCSSLSSICATPDPDGNKELQNPPDESHMLINMEMSLFSLGGEEEEVKKNSCDLDKSMEECNSTYLKEENYVEAEDIKFSVKKDGTEETKKLRKDVSDVSKEVELKLQSSRKKNEELRSDNVFNNKQMSCSIMKSKSKSSLVQRTPKRLIIHDMKENDYDGRTTKGTTPKTSSKRPPLRPIWK